MTLESSEWCVPNSVPPTPTPGSEFGISTFSSIDNLRAAGLTKTWEHEGETYEEGAWLTPGAKTIDFSGFESLSEDDKREALRNLASMSLYHSGIGIINREELLQKAIDDEATDESEWSMFDIANNPVVTFNTDIQDDIDYEPHSYYPSLNGEMDYSLNGFMVVKTLSEIKADGLDAWFNVGKGK